MGNKFYDRSRFHVNEAYVEEARANACDIHGNRIEVCTFSERRVRGLLTDDRSTDEIVNSGDMDCLDFTSSNGNVLFGNPLFHSRIYKSSPLDF